MQSVYHMRFIISTVLMLLHTTSSNKSNARPVYEVINEQARIDDNFKISNSPSVLPYGNPLAGNQNARIHISNQQAMFHAEKVRQHRAQIQRLAQAPKLDSYMRAYHESQDNLQLAIEQQQATQQDNAVTKPTILNRAQNTPKQKVNTLKKRPQTIPEMMSRPVQHNTQKQDSSRKNNPARKTDGVRNMKYRGQRSYGAVEYQQYLNPQKHKFLYLNSLKDLGVTIKPNGNVGVATMENKEPSKLYTEAISSDTKNVYPKQYNQMQYYKTINEAETSDLLSKGNEGLSAYSSLQNSDTSEIPIDFYFYLKDPSKSVADPIDNTKLVNTYASAYMSDYSVKDYIPITENVDDIEDPNVFKSTQPFIPQTQPRPTPVQDETTTETTNHYYKIEVANQILTSKHNPDETKEVLYYKQEDDLSTPTQTLHYPLYPAQTDDNKNKYIHHNAQNTGVQHLSEDGFGASAFADDVSINKPTSIKNRRKRSELNNEAFLLPNEREPDTTSTTDNPISEPLIRLNPSLKKYNNNNFNVFVSPNVPLTNTDDDYFQEEQVIDPFYDEYNDYDENLNDDVGAPTNIRPIINVDNNYHLDTHDTYAHKFKHKRNPMYGISHVHRRIPKPNPFSYHAYDQVIDNERYNLPVRYGTPRVNTLANIADILEPVYMITQSELKQLLDNHKLNIEHVDVYQIPKPTKPKRTVPYPKYHKRSPYRYRNHKIRNKLHKLNKFF